AAGPDSGRRRRTRWVSTRDERTPGRRSTTASLARDPSREQAPIVTEDRPSGGLSRSDPDGDLALRPHPGTGGKVRRFALTVLAAIVALTVAAPVAQAAPSPDYQPPPV